MPPHPEVTRTSSSPFRQVTCPCVPRAAIITEVLQRVIRTRSAAPISRLSPEALYRGATITLLAPDSRTFDIVAPEQVDRAVPGVLTLPQSLLLVWQQITALVAVTVALFAGAYVAFMRQEIRA